MSIFLIAGGVLTVACYPLAWWGQNQSQWSAVKKQSYSNIIGALFAFALFFFLDSLLRVVRGTSFLYLFGQGSMMPIIVFAGGFVEGIIYEYFGQFALDAWYYPLIRLKKIFLFALPIFWGIFMLVIQDAYAIVRSFSGNVILSAVLAAMVLFALIEGVNTFTRSWVYASRFKLHAFILGWILLVLTFVLGFNHTILNPFGL